jgi:hypothetical protein
MANTPPDVCGSICGLFSRFDARDRVLPVREHALRVRECALPSAEDAARRLQDRNSNRVDGYKAAGLTSLEGSLRLPVMKDLSWNKI